MNVITKDGKSIPVGALDLSKAVIKCDAENNTPDIIDSGKILIDIAIPLRFSNEYLRLPPLELDRDMEQNK